MGNYFTKRLWMGVAATLMVLGASSSARADETLVANVPFAFIVGNLHMPAGRYVVTEITGNGLVSVASSDRKHFTFVLTNGVVAKGDRSNPELVFDKVGDNHFLSQIIDQDNAGREIPLKPESARREVDRVAAAWTR